MSVQMSSIQILKFCKINFWEFILEMHFQKHTMIYI